MIIDKIRTWSDWKRHWAKDGDGLPEKMGLLHHGFEYPEPGMTSERLFAEKGFFYLCIVKTQNKTNPDSDETRLAMKAKDVLIRNFFSRIGQSVFGLRLSSSEVDMLFEHSALIDMCVEFVCDPDSFAFTNHRSDETAYYMSRFAISLANTVLTTMVHTEWRRKMLKFLFCTSPRELKRLDIGVTKEELAVLTNSLIKAN